MHKPRAAERRDLMNKAFRENHCLFAEMKYIGFMVFFLSFFCWLHFRSVNSKITVGCCVIGMGLVRRFWIYGYPEVSFCSKSLHFFWFEDPNEFLVKYTDRKIEVWILYLTNN